MHIRRWIVGRRGTKSLSDSRLHASLLQNSVRPHPSCVFQVHHKRIAPRDSEEKCLARTRANVERLQLVAPNPCVGDDFPRWQPPGFRVGGNSGENAVAFGQIIADHTLPPRRLANFERNVKNIPKNKIIVSDCVRARVTNRTMKNSVGRIQGASHLKTIDALPPYWSVCIKTQPGPDWQFLFRQSEMTAERVAPQRHQPPLWPQLSHHLNRGRRRSAQRNFLWEGKPFGRHYHHFHNRWGVGLIEPRVGDDGGEQVGRLVPLRRAYGAKKT